MTIGVGLAGFGLAGRYLHAPLIAAAGMEIRAVATSRHEDLHTAFPAAEPVAAAADLNARSDIDLVVIATPNALHAAQAGAALRAGKHVVVDKPATPTAAGTLELGRLAGETDRKLAVYHNRRWDADFLTLRAQLEAGAIGAPRRFVNRWRRHRPDAQDRWREKPGPAGGLFYDLGPHLIDQALVLFGWPDWIQADIFAQREGASGAVDDGFELLLAKGEVRITLGASSFAAGPFRRLRLDGALASLEVTGFDPQEPALRAGGSPRDPGFGAGEGAVTAMLWTQNGEALPVSPETGRWLDFYAGMRRAIEDDAPAPVGAFEAAQSIALIEAGFESARTGRRIAPAPLPPI